MPGETKPEVFGPNVTELHAETKIACKWTGCKNEAFSTFDVRVKNEPNARASLPFCKYHVAIVMGDNFHCFHEARNISKDPKKPKTIDFFAFDGPVDKVQLIEQVMAAREVTKEKDVEVE